MVTNHGIHDWNVDAGLPDTGGQNVYVNQLSAILVKLGFRVTIYNRGGYPHPADGSPRSGARYRNEYERIVYLEDSVAQFVPKEEMGPRVPELAADMARRLSEEKLTVDAIISHYWEGAAVAHEAREQLELGAAHIWVPHSLGALKRQSTPREDWPALRLNERIEEERFLLSKVHYVGCTSKVMEYTLRQDYGFEGCKLLPPCVDTSRFDPERVREDHSARTLLAEALGCSEDEIAQARLITEVSRTDRTKRKDILIRAFARVKQHYTDTVLAVTIDRSHTELYDELTRLIEELGVHDSVAVLGSVWKYVPSLYGMTHVYCTPSVMEGFGMSIQEAAACRVPAVASDRVPFAVEFLQGNAPTPRTCGAGEETIQMGEAAIIAPSDNVACTAEALELLLQDAELHDCMGERAYQITIPRFTWEHAASQFLRECGVLLPTNTVSEHSTGMSS
jgi:mannosylfructose-phosphate synthase